MAVIVSVVSLIAISRVQWPAFPSSNQLHALTTVGQVGCLAGLVAVGWLWRRGGRFRLPAQLGGLVFVSAFTVVTLGMPLGATKLYLFGISVDQQFRTEYLTRLADSPALHDMTYLGLPPFYPPGWFWIGGRVAALTGTPGVGDVQAVGDHLDHHRGRRRAGAVVADDPLRVRADRHHRHRGGDAGLQLAGALLRDDHGAAAAGAGADVVGLCAPASAGGWAAVVGAGLFLGFTATWYTLLFGFTAFTMALMALAAGGCRAGGGTGAKPRSTRCAGWPSSPSSRRPSRRPPGCRSCCGRCAARSATPAVPCTTCRPTAPS